MAERKDLRDLLRDTDFTQKRIIDDLANAEADPGASERDISGDISRSEGGDFIKNVFLGLLLVGIVIGSFWVSFLIGKKVLVPPVKNLPTMEIPAPKAISQADIEKAEPVKEEPVMEKEITAAPVKAPVVKKKPITVTLKQAKPGQLYKVTMGSYKTMSDAQKVTASLKHNGFVSFIKKVGVYYRVQVGAFDTKEKASPLVARLKAKGYSPKVIVE